MLNFRLIYITWMHFGGSKLLELSHMIAEFHTQIRNNSCIQFGFFFFFLNVGVGVGLGVELSQLSCADSKWPPVQLVIYFIFTESALNVDVYVFKCLYAA